MLTQTAPHITTLVSYTMHIRYSFPIACDGVLQHVRLFGASLSEPHMTRSTASMSVYNISIVHLAVTFYNYIPHYQYGCRSRRL